MASGNPFVSQRPVDDLIDREAELQRLLDLAAGAHFMRVALALMGLPLGLAIRTLRRIK